MASPIEQVHVVAASYDSLGIRRSPGLEYALAWLRSRAPDSTKKEDAASWWALLDLARQTVNCASRGAGFRGGKLSLDDGIAGRQVSEAEMECLVAIAEATGSSAQAVVEDTSTAPKKKPKRAGDDDDDEEDCTPTLPTNAELVRGVQRLIADHLMKDGAEAARSLSKALDVVALNLDMSAAAEESEAMSIAHVLDMPSQKCQVCGVNLGTSADASIIGQLRSELAHKLRDDEIPIDTPGLLRHFLTTTGRKLAQDQPESPRLAPIRSML